MIWKEDEYKKLLEDIKDKKRDEIFAKLAEFTYLNYLEPLQKVIKVFPTPVYKIYKWKQYKGKSRSNIGLDLELVIVNYLKEKGIEAELIPNGRGKDVKIEELDFEIKSSSTSYIHTMLNSTFYKNDPDKFYLFITNTKEEDIKLRIVSSQLLYRIALGEELFQEIINNQSNTLDKQIKEGLDNLDFTSTIKASLLGEQFESSKTFSVGNNINIRFTINFEPKK